MKGAREAAVHPPEIRRIRPAPRTATVAGPALVAMLLAVSGVLSAQSASSVATDTLPHVSPTAASQVSGVGADADDRGTIGQNPEAVTPARGDAAAWALGGIGFGAVTFELWRSDQKTFRFLDGLKNHNLAIRDVSPVVTQMGQGTFSIAGFSGLLAYGFIAGDTHAEETARNGFESFLLSGFAAQAIKLAVGRERPSAATEPGGRVHGPFSYLRGRRHHSIAAYDSFPSGHTTTAFSTAAILADSYPGGWVPVISYGTATIVAVSRVMEHTHWLSDCFVGAALGILSARMVEHWHEAAPVSLGLTSTGHTYELALSCRL